MTKPDTSLHFSFEFFPVKTHAAETQLLSTADTLSQLNPRFFSVTHGALKSTTARTEHTVFKLLQGTNVPVAAHITACNLDKSAAIDWIHSLYEKGVRHVVALRGDDRDKLTSQHFQNAAEFIAAIREQFPSLEISAAAYPNMHKEAKSMAAEFAYTKLKLEAGADQLITQFYFDPNAVYALQDYLHQSGINKPVIAGILPITDWARLCTMADYCKVPIPDSIAAQYQPVANDPIQQAQLAVENGIQLVQKTRHLGIHHFHFYCLNRAEVVKAIIEGL